MLLVALSIGCGAGQRAGPHAVPTEAGRYRVEVSAMADAVEVVLWDADGRVRIEDAAVRVSVGGERWLDDPGECDAVGEARCAHFGGLYASRRPERTAPDSRAPVEGAAVALEIDGPAGIDRWSGR